MDQKINNKEFEDLVQDVLNHEFLLGLLPKRIYSIASNKVEFDFVDIQMRTFVEVKTNFMSKNRPEVVKNLQRLSFNASKLILTDELRFILVFDSILSTNDRNYFTDQLKRIPKVDFVIFDINQIVKLAKKFEIKINELFLKFTDDKSEKILETKNISNNDVVEKILETDLISVVFETNLYTKEKANFWWLTASPRYFDNEKVEFESVYKYPSKTINNTFKANFKIIKKGDYVITFDTKKTKVAYALAIVVKITDDHTYLKIIYMFDKKIERYTVKNFPNLYKTSVGKSASAPLLQINLESFSEVINFCVADLERLFNYVRSSDLFVYREIKVLTFDTTITEIIENVDSSINPKEHIEYVRSEAISLDHGDKDSLDFRKDVQSLAALIALKEMKPPLAIALFGKWGTGKSFFMNSLEKRIRELSSFQGFRESDIDNDLSDSSENKEELFLRGIAHIKFNAWSYLDANLWAGLVSTIFERLNQYLTDETKSNVAKLIVQEKLVEQLKALNILSEEAHSRKKSLNVLKSAFEDEIDNIETENQKLFNTEILNLINSDDDLEKLYKELRKNNYVPQQLLVELKFDEIINEVNNWKRFWANIKTRKSLYKYLIIGFIGVISTILLNWFFIEFKNINWISSLFIVGATLGFDITKFKKVYSTVTKYRNLFNKLSQENNEFKNVVIEFKTKIQQADEQIELADKHSKEIKEKIEKIKFDIELNITNLTISDFVKERSNHDDYKKNIGIVSIVRKDFETLSELFLTKENEEPVMDESLFKHGKSLRRIVLYIDDLDRCSDDKVLEVLQAVHLLMAFPLFTVVVGVDERSVHNALKFQQLKRYQNIDITIIKDKIKEIEPREYLEKIFQIPFQLPEASETGITQLIDDIIIVSNEKPTNEMGKSAQMSELEMGDSFDVDHDQIDIQVEGLNELSEDERFLETEILEETAKSIQPTEIKITAQEKAYLQLFAPIVGNNPRTIKRYINIFRIVKTHENDVFNSDDDTLKIVFLIAFLTGKHRSLAIEFFGSNQKRLNQFLFELPEERGRPLLRQIEELRPQENRVGDILVQTPEKYIMLLKFVQRFSYKLDTLN